MTSSHSSILTKVIETGVSSAFIDVIRYLPRGIGQKQITTPDGVHLNLEGLSPITIGRFRAGDAEVPERQLLSKVPSNMEIVELGAGTGYLTTLLNKRTNRPHLAVEPNPVVFPVLRRTRELNDASFQPLDRAYHPEQETVEFPKTKYFKTSTIQDADRTAVVKATSLSELLMEHELEKPFLHVDIEGSERLMFDAELDVVREECCGLLIEFHPDKLENNVHAYIAQLKDTFKLVNKQQNVALFMQ